MIEGKRRMLTFDHVRLDDDTGARVITADDYLALPIERRVRLISAGRSTFLLRGCEVPRREAIASLRRRS